MPKKILFVTHEASRAGSPVLLLRLLRWLKTNTDIPFEVLVKSGGGSLMPEFEAVAPVTVLDDKEPYPPTFSQKIWDLRLKKAFRAFMAKKRIAAGNIGLVYCNAALGDMMEFLSFIKCPAIYHVHEMAHVLNGNPGNLEKIKKYTGQYIAASNAVKKGLVEDCHVPGAKIETVYEFVPTSEIKSGSGRKTICAKLGIPEGSAIICSSGNTEWCKSPDIFVQLAQAVRARLSKPVYFLWVGGGGQAFRKAKLKEALYDVKELDLEDRVRFLGETAEPFDYFSACDVFVSVSRADSFPIACLEAAFLGKPIICFKDAGGAEEFVGDDAGFVISYLDVEAMAAKAIELINVPELRQRLGRQAKEKVAKNYDIEILAPRLLGIIRRFLR